MCPGDREKGLINISSGLNDFLLLDRIDICRDKDLQAEKLFYCPSSYMLIEACTQAATFHARYLLNFKQHAFLLKINSLNFYSGSKLPGSIRLEVLKINASQRTYAYRVKAFQQNELFIQGKLLIGTIEYQNRRIQVEHRDFYQKAFSCLSEGSSPD